MLIKRGDAVYDSENYCRFFKQGNFIKAQRKAGYEDEVLAIIYIPRRSRRKLIALTQKILSAMWRALRQKADSFTIDEFLYL